MRYLLLFFWPIMAYSIEHNIIFENDYVCLSKFKLLPHEEVDFHRDEYPHIVIANTGGIIKRFEPDGTSTEIPLPTGEAVFRPQDPFEEGHRSINISDNLIEAFIIQLKKP